MQYSWQTFRRDGVGVTAPLLADGLANYTPGISERRSGTTKYLHGGLKNKSAQTISNQTVAGTKSYDAFGNLLTSSGTWSGNSGYGGNFGYQTDPDSGLKLLDHRYYDPTIGRFLTRDPAKDGRNWYSYCENNPISYFDAEGLKKTLVIIVGDLLDPDIRSSAYKLIAALVAHYGDTYHIVTRVCNTPEEVISALAEGDAAVMIGHGAPFQTRQDKIIRYEDYVKAAIRRAKAGRGKLDFLLVYSCSACLLEDDLDAFAFLTNRLFGFSGDCYLGDSAKDLFGAGGKWFDLSNRSPRNRPRHWYPKATIRGGGVRSIQ